MKLKLCGEPVTRLAYMRKNVHVSHAAELWS
jgi:hypothetical protein